MTRRWWLISTLALPLRGDDALEAWDTLAAVAVALGQGNASAFLAAFDPAIPGFGALGSDVRALVSAWNVQSSIELVASVSSEKGPILEVEWLLHVTMRNEAARAVRGRHQVKCRFEKQGKRWKIVAFEPLGLFAPPRV